MMPVPSAVAIRRFLLPVYPGAGPTRKPGLAGAPLYLESHHASPTSITIPVAAKVHTDRLASGEYFVHEQTEDDSFSLRSAHTESGGCSNETIGIDNSRPYGLSSQSGGAGI